MKNKAKKIIIIVLVVLIVIGIIGISYAFFKYVKKGQIINTAITNNLNFSYQENACNANYPGISLTNSMPIPDSEGISSNTCGEIFDFKIDANTEASALNYTITAKITSDQNIDYQNIKIYLAAITDDNEIQTESTYFNGEVAVLDDFYALDETEPSEKIIYTENIAKGNKKFNKQFRLKIWLDEHMILYDNTDPDNIIDNREQSFNIRVNVYAEASVPKVVGKATDWIVTHNPSDNSVTLESTINDFIKEYSKPQDILKDLLAGALYSENLQHYFKGKLKEELVWYYQKIINEEELDETDLTESIPLIFSLFDEDPNNDIDILAYALITDFKNMEITPKMVIPSVIVYPDGTKYNVKKISNELFSCVNIKGEEKLDHKNITEVTISEGIEYIGTVKEINQIQDIILGPFDYCTNLTKVTLPSTLKEIGNRAFINTSISKINLPFGLTKIGVEAFSESKITKLIIPSTVEMIEQVAFSRNDIRKVLFAGNSNLTMIGRYSFNGNKITDLFIPASVTTIEHQAFEYNDISTLIFEDTITRPASITELKDYTFGGNDLKTIIIPASITKIASSTFSGSPNLSNIIVRRADATGLNFEEGWNGYATVIFEP